jgi:hypothetical protein
MELSKPLGDHELLIGAEHKVLAYGDTTTNFVDLTYNNAPWVTSRDDLSYKSSSEGVCRGCPRPIGGPRDRPTAIRCFLGADGAALPDAV